MSSPIDVCTVFSTKHNMFVRVWRSEQRRIRCSLPPDPVRVVSFLLKCMMDFRSLEETGAGHPDLHGGNIVLQTMGEYV